MRPGGWRARLSRWAGVATLRTRLVALWLLWRDPRTPWAPKAVALAVLAYALSPIDLIPDFIPVLGLLDDLVLLPLGLALVVRLTPPALWADCLHRAEQHARKLPRWLAGALLIGLFWLLLAAGLGWWLWGAMQGGA